MIIFTPNSVIKSADMNTNFAEPITNAKLSTTTGELGGIWKDFTPSFSGLSGTASSTVDCKYTQIGKTVLFYINIKFGGTDKPNGNITFNLPVTARTLTLTGNYRTIGVCDYNDDGVNSYSGKIRGQSTTVGQFLVDVASGSYHSYAAVSATAPFAWGANDGFFANGFYEAA